MPNPESSTPATGMLAVKDQAGNYYLVPQATLEQCRVPAEHAADVAQLMADAAQGGADVQGFLVLINGRPWSEGLPPSKPPVPYEDPGGGPSIDFLPRGAPSPREPIPREPI
jgi:hypothetical protein